VVDDASLALPFSDLRRFLSTLLPREADPLMRTIALAMARLELRP